MKRTIATLAMLLCMVSLQAQTLLIYGGSDHDVFLGKPERRLLRQRVDME